MPDPFDASAVVGGHRRDGGANGGGSGDRRSDDTDGRAEGEPDRLPHLEAGPYLLRGFEPRDADMVMEAAADPLIPLIASMAAGAGPAEASEFVARQRRRLRDGFGYSFVVAVASSGRGVGSIGLWLADVDQGRASVGYWIVASARGRGAATHALRAVSAWALDELRIPRLEIHAEPWNVPSVRTAEAAGFHCEGLLRSWQEVAGERRDVYVYSLLATDQR